MPHDVFGWLALILKIGLPFLSGGYLLTRILAHSVSLSGQRTSDDNDPAVTCRFALQNNEEVSVTSREQLSIRILDEGGQFDNAAPVTVYAGWNNIKAGLSQDGKLWTMQFDELPAYDTWTIDCTMNREARNVEVTLQEAGAPLISSTFLSHDRLMLTSDRKSAFAGHRTKP